LLAAAGTGAVWLALAGGISAAAGPSIVLKPTSGSSGSMFYIYGNGFNPGDTVTISWDHSMSLNPATANGSGYFGPTQETVPGATPGTYLVWATGSSSGPAPPQQFTVTAATTTTTAGTTTTAAATTTTIGSTTTTGAHPTTTTAHTSTTSSGGGGTTSASTPAATSANGPGGVGPAGTSGPAVGTSSKLASGTTTNGNSAVSHVDVAGSAGLLAALVTLLVLVTERRLTPGASVLDRLVRKGST
jgi:hypothetical protein